VHMKEFNLTFSIENSATSNLFTFLAVHVSVCKCGWASNISLTSFLTYNLNRKRTFLSLSNVIGTLS